MIVNADAAHIPLADGTVHCVVTSPPYWGLRRYVGVGERGIGLEKTLEEYVANLLAVFREVRRVLRDDGIAWLNLGDAYADSGKAGSNPEYQKRHLEFGKPSTNTERFGLSGLVPKGLKSGDLLGLPWRVAFALQADGWTLRSAIVWAKGVSFCPTYSGSVMPESVGSTRWERCKVKIVGGKRGRERQRLGANPARPQQDHNGSNFSPSAEWRDCPGCPKCSPNGGYILRRGAWRPTSGYEMVFMLTKGMDYWSDGEAVKEVASTAIGSRTRQSFGSHKKLSTPDLAHAADCGKAYREERGGFRNLRNVWVLNPEAFPGSHFSTFPTRLVKPCIESATSEKGVCPKCGSQWARVVERQAANRDDTGRTKSLSHQRMGKAAPPEKGWESETRTIGWRPTCSCPPADPIPAVVLDPFSGSGTTVLVARRLGRRGIGLDLSCDYCAMARERLAGRVAAPEAQAQSEPDLLSVAR